MTIKVGTKMKTIKLNKNGKCRKPRAKKPNWSTIDEAIRDDIIRFAEAYWDQNGLYNDADLDDIINKIEQLYK